MYIPLFLFLLCQIICIFYCFSDINILINTYNVESASINAISILTISSTIHALGYLFYCSLKNYKKINYVKLRYKINKILYFLLIFLIFQIVLFLFKFYEYIQPDIISLDFLMGRIQPLFPGQLGIYFVTSVFLITLVGISNNIHLKYNILLLFIFASILLQKKYLLILGIFIFSYQLNFLVKIFYLITSIIFYLGIDSYRNNLSEISLNYAPDNYWSVSIINFIHISDSNIFNNYLYPLINIIKDEDNVLLLEPTAGPGYIGSLYISGGFIPLIIYSFLMGILMAFLWRICNKSLLHRFTLSPLFIFSVLMTVQGNVFLNPVLFIAPFFVIYKISNYLNKGAA